MIEKKDLNQSDSFVEAASHLIVYQIKTSWLNIQKIGDKMSKKYDVTLSIAFVLMAIFEDEGTPVTKIAPRIGLEPNSLSRVLKTMEQKKFIKKIADKKDKRIKHPEKWGIKNFATAEISQIAKSRIASGW